MKQYLLIVIMMLTSGIAKSQSADYFIKNGDLMARVGNTTSTFERGWKNPIIDFAEGELNGKYFVIYWQANGDSKICTISETGKWSSKSDFRCRCGKHIDKIKFIDSQTLIITCTDGKRYKRTFTAGGGSTESSY